VRGFAEFVNEADEDEHPWPLKRWHISQHGYGYDVHHPDTGEPVFRAVKVMGEPDKEHYLDRYRLHWHDHMRDTHGLSDMPINAPGDTYGYGRWTHYELQHRTKDLYAKHARQDFKEEKESWPVKYSDDESEVTVHHPETGEPILHGRVVSRGRATNRNYYRVEWHPYMLDMHPHLEPGSLGEPTGGIHSWSHHALEKKTPILYQKFAKKLGG